MPAMTISVELPDSVCRRICIICTEFARNDIERVKTQAFAVMDVASELDNQEIMWGIATILSDWTFIKRTRD